MCLVSLRSDVALLKFACESSQRFDQCDCLPPIPDDKGSTPLTPAPNFLPSGPLLDELRFRIGTNDDVIFEFL